MIYNLSVKSKYAIQKEKVRNMCTFLKYISKYSATNGLMRLMLIVQFLAVCHMAFPQTSVSYDFNAIRVGDNVCKDQIAYLHSANSGKDVTWDFSNMQRQKRYQIDFYCDSDSVIIFELTPDRINKYSADKNALLLVGIENPLEKIDYSEPVKYLEYPFSYGDSFVSPYSGKGTYCKTHNIETSGNIDVEADGAGALILSDEDTISNVIRIHSIRSGAVFMHLDNDSTDEAKSRIKQEIEERYQWYARGYRYPLLETVSTSYYKDMDLVSCIQKAYCYAPELQRTLHDEQNDSIQRIDSISNVQIADIFHYKVETIGNQVKLSYSLDEDANITIVVCNHRGMAYRRRSFAMPAGSGYMQNIDCSGLRPDTYILYLNVNGKIYSEKIETR